MEERQKAVGRGLKLLEKIKARTPGQLSEDESPLTPASSSMVSGELSLQSAESSETTSQKKPSGRGHLLAQIKTRAQQYESEPKGRTMKTEIGVSSSETKHEVAKKGRGFLTELAKQSRDRGPLVSQITESPVQVKSEPSIVKQMQEMSLKETETESEMEKPPVIKRGDTGEKIGITTNFITLTVDPGKGVFEFDVRFSPEVDYVAYRYKLINQHFKTRRGIRCYDGGDKLYMPEKMTTDKIIIDAEHPNDLSPVQIVLTYKRQMKLKECSQLYNILLNNCSKALNLTRLGRQHYDYRLGHHIPQHKLEVWPGYVTSVEEFEGGIHLCCDIRHRVLRTETALDVIQSVAKYDSRNFKNLIVKELLGQCVLTRYNNNLYRIDDIDWEKNPLTTFKLSSGEDITFLDYYKKQYNLHIKDLKQPLLINKPKTKKADQTSRFICLVPELCHLTGLTDKMRKDMKVMKEIAAYTRVTPAQRHLGFKKFLENLQNNSLAQEMLNDWGLKIASEPSKLDARVLPQEEIILRGKTRYPAPPNMEWSKYLRQNGVFRGTSIKHWLLVHTKRDSNLAHSFWNMLMKVCPGLGVDICDPTLVPLADDRIDSYIKAVRENISQNSQMVVCLCPTPREDRYSAIKKLCCRDLPIPSQVINCATISRENRMRSVVQNIALQMNNKLGGASWAINIPMKNTMICGIDSYHDADKKGRSVGAFVASVDAEFTQWYSKTCIQEPKQELVDGLVCSFALALRKYLEVNNILPERIIIFRDGVGDGQLSIVQNHEVAQFLETCEMITKRYKPKFSFVVVQKRINTKFYQCNNGNDYENPRSGSVLDHTVTRRNFYDFFLVSQYVSCGTATPSHYIVLHDTSELRPDLMQRLTYKCCHMYYNWAGTVRVPAPCQYAHKLAYLVGQNIKELPKDVLDDKLFYL